MSKFLCKQTRGTLVVVEGLDKAGKSTQCAKLVENLQQEGSNVRHIRFPDRTTPIGKMIDTYLRGQTQQEDHVIHLLFSANRWEIAKQIEEDISLGMVVVIDRYYYSGCVYSAAKNIPGLDLLWARCPDVGLPRPDICVFLDISVEKAAQRGGFGEERYENNEMQDRVRRLFKELRSSQDKEDFHIVDAGQTQEEVQSEVLDALLGTSVLGFGNYNRGITPSTRNNQDTVFCRTTQMDKRDALSPPNLGQYDSSKKLHRSLNDNEQYEELG
ncbi:MAG: Thymidylate kinase [Pycnora praestabilis]|nr:MAG: Thymidylate kinase [Pycnora praestabilis]